MMSENPFELPVEEENEDNGAPTETSSIAELRKAYNRAEKRAAAAEKAAQELAAFREAVIEEKRETALTAAFTAVQLNPAQAKLFKLANPNIEVEAITTEVVLQFAAENGLVAVSGDAVAAPAAAPSGYKPVVTGSAPPLASYTTADIEELMARGDFEAVNRAYKEGRVQKDTAPWLKP